MFKIDNNSKNFVLSVFTLWKQVKKLQLNTKQLQLNKKKFDIFLEYMPLLHV